jgi:hypothetical protein
MHLDAGFALGLPADARLYRAWPADLAVDSDTRLATFDDYEQAGCEWARFKGTPYAGPRHAERGPGTTGAALADPASAA